MLRLHEREEAGLFCPIAQLVRQQKQDGIPAKRGRRSPYVATDQPGGDPGNCFGGNVPGGDVVLRASTDALEDVNAAVFATR